MLNVIFTQLVSVVASDAGETVLAPTHAPYSTLQCKRVLRGCPQRLADPRLRLSAMRGLSWRFHQNELLGNIRSRRTLGRLSLQQDLAVQRATSAFTFIQPTDINGVSLLAVIVGVYASQRPVGWSIAAVQVRNSPVSGKGVFAVEEIAAETVIGRYPGVLRSAAEVTVPHL